MALLYSKKNYSSNLCCWNKISTNFPLPFKSCYMYLKLPSHFHHESSHHSFYQSLPQVLFWPIVEFLPPEDFISSTLSISFTTALTNHQPTLFVPSTVVFVGLQATTFIPYTTFVSSHHASFISATAFDWKPI